MVVVFQLAVGTVTATPENPFPEKLKIGFAWPNAVDKAAWLESTFTPCTPFEERPRLLVSRRLLLKSTDTDPFRMAEAAVVLVASFLPPPMNTCIFCANCPPCVMPMDCAWRLIS